MNFALNFNYVNQFAMSIDGFYFYHSYIYEPIDYSINTNYLRLA
jgi:hypothetical protein